MSVIGTTGGDQGNYNFWLLWEKFFQQMAEFSTFAVPDRVWRYCMHTMPTLNLSPAEISLNHAVPQVAEPMRADVPDSKAYADAEMCSEFMDYSDCVCIPVEDVRLLFKKQEHNGQMTAWLALSFDMMMIQMKKLREERFDVSRLNERRGQKAREALDSPRPVSRNENLTSAERPPPLLTNECLPEALAGKANYPRTFVEFFYSGFSAVVGAFNPPYLPFAQVEGAPDVEVWDVVQVDGMGAHITINYLPERYCQVFREVFEAMIALLPEGSYFRAKLSINQMVLPTKRLTKAHSFMMDLKRSPPDKAMVGEFAEAFDLQGFIETVWEFAVRRLTRDFRVPMDRDEMAKKTNLHVSIPAFEKNSYDIKRCSAPVRTSSMLVKYWHQMDTRLKAYRHNHDNSLYAAFDEVEGVIIVSTGPGAPYVFGNRTVQNTPREYSTIDEKGNLITVHLEWPDLPTKYHEVVAKALEEEQTMMDLYSGAQWFSLAMRPQSS